MYYQIDALVYLNRLRYLPPWQKLGFTLTLMFLSYVSDSVVRLLISFWVVIWVVVYARIPIGVYLRLLMIPVGFWLMSFPVLALGLVSFKDLTLVTSDAWLGVNLGPIYLYLSKQGITQGVELFLRAIALTSSMYLLLLTTPFAEILQILTKIGCPHLLIELLALMYRFIFLLTQTTSQLLLAQRCRSGYTSFKKTIASLGLLVSQLLQRSLNNYRETVLALESRGFRGNILFWDLTIYQSKPRYTREAIAGCLCLLLYTIWEHVNRI